MSDIILYKSPVKFDKETHTYMLEGKRLNGVTSTLLKRAFPNKYNGVPEAIMNKAAQRGSMVHEDIELHDVFSTEADNDIIESYDRMKLANGLSTVANEYLVSDEEHYASSIDIVFSGLKGEISLADIKTTYKFDKQSVSLQLSIYKMFFERSNPGLKVEHLYGIWARNGETKLVEVSVVDESVIKALMEADIQNKDYQYKPNPEWFDKVGDRLDKLMVQKTEIDQEIEEIKAELLENMKKEDISQLKTPSLTISYTQPSQRVQFNIKDFKTKHEDLFEEYAKKIEVKSSISIRNNKTK